MLVERVSAGSVERQPARPDLDEDVLRGRLTHRIQSRVKKLGRAILHAPMREARARDARRVRHDALHAGEHTQAQRIPYGFGLDEARELQPLFDIEALAAQNGIDGRGQHEHVLVEAQCDIGHIQSFPRLTSYQKNVAAHVLSTRMRASPARRATSRPPSLRERAEGDARGLLRPALVHRRFGPVAQDEHAPIIGSPTRASILHRAVERLPLPSIACFESRSGASASHPLLVARRSSPLPGPFFSLCAPSAGRCRPNTAFELPVPPPDEDIGCTMGHDPGVADALTTQRRAQPSEEDPWRT